MTIFSVGRDEGGPSRRPNQNQNQNPKRMRLQLISDSDSDQDGGEIEPTGESYNSSETQRTIRSSDVRNGEQDLEMFLSRVNAVVSGREVTSTLHNQSQVPPAVTELGSNRAVNNVAQAVNNVVNSGVEEEGSQVMTLSDPDVLDCPICLNPLSIPVYQCENGHVTCSSCSSKVRNKCPSCTFPTGYTRCRALEKVLESVKVSCRNAKYGCTEKTSYCHKNAHDNMCTYGPCSCPKLHCQFIGPVKKLSEHFFRDHPYTAARFRFDIMFRLDIDPHLKHIILIEDRGLLFIINNKEFQSLGNFITITCIQPRRSKEYLYTVGVEKGGCVLKMDSVAENISERAENMDWKKFLMVPRHFVNPYGKLSLDIIIENERPQSPPQQVRNDLRRCV